MKSPRSNTVGCDWISTNEGVFYLKYPDHKGALEGSSTEKHKFHSLYYQKLGTDCKMMCSWRFQETMKISWCDGRHGDGKTLLSESAKVVISPTAIYKFDAKYMT
uniref:Uncharacterized protein n=1 Tax=Ditylenchus dipsaci TaxID=166011 RepID=A0A915EK57_9BILA